MGPPRRGGSTPEPARSLLSRIISTISAARCDASNRNGGIRRPWSGGLPRQSLPSSPFFHAGFALVGSFSPVVAGFSPAAAFFFVAFFLNWVLEAGLAGVEPLLPVEPDPYPDPYEEARWREAEAFAGANCVALRY